MINPKNESEEHLFTCKECGCHDLVVKEYGTIIESLTATQECTCEKGQDGLAYERHYDLFTPYLESYYLDEDHHFNEKASDHGYEFEEELEEPWEEDIEENIYCEDCYDPTGECDIEEDNFQELEVIEREFYVACADCEREIEFGWSHPNRGGRIWPAECTDFNPWKCWPELRYREKWKKKGWLRPSNDR